MRSKKAIYNIITNLLMQGVAIVYGFVIPKIIIDYFGSDVNGLVSSITQFLAYITLLESGFGPVVKAVLYKPIAKKDNGAIASIIKTSEKFFRRIAMIFILYIIILCFVFPLIIKAEFGAVFTVSLVIVMAISTFSEYFFGMAYRLFLRAEQKTYIVSIIQAVTYLLSVAAVVVLAIIGCSILVIEFVVALLFVLRPIMQNLYVKKKYNLNLESASSNYPIKQKWDGLSQHIAAVVHANVDVTILTFFTTLADVSVYSVYCLVVTGIKRIVESFNNGLDALFGDMIAKKEKDNLEKKFSAYELLFIMVVAIFYSTTIIMITPFVVIYTNGVTDADYYRPIFGILLAVSGYICAIRTPYQSLTLAAGHFKETRRGAWVEAIVNIIISVILVFKFGLVGVAIGTIVAMTIRTVEFIYHANKYILKRSARESVCKIFVAVLVTVATVLIMNCVNLDATTGFGAWIVCALIVFFVANVISFLLFFIIYRDDFKIILRRARRIIIKKKK